MQRWTLSVSLDPDMTLYITHVLMCEPEKACPTTCIDQALMPVASCLALEAGEKTIVY
jgi:hypothetical protein